MQRGDAAKLGLMALFGAAIEPLLTRRRRGVEPTPTGQALLARARSAVRLDRLRVELGRYGQGVQGSAHVFASPSAFAESLPDDVRRSWVAIRGTGSDWTNG